MKTLERNWLNRFVVFTDFLQETRSIIICHIRSFFFNLTMICYLQNENKITKDGCIVIKSEATRSQHLNMAHVLDKLRTMIRKTLEKPAEISAETEEVLRKRQMKAARQRVFTKRHRQMLNSDIQPRD